MGPKMGMSDRVGKKGLREKVTGVTCKDSKGMSDIWQRAWQA